MPRRRLRIRRPLEIREGDRSIRVEPARSLRISYGVEYADPAIGRQRVADLEIDEASFEGQICRARTFGFLHDVEHLWRLGFARGGNLDNTVVMDDDRVLNADGLRWRDEFVRHKVLDLIGDLALVGMPVAGPARCTSMTTIGSSRITARPIASLLSARPGPDVPVSAKSPVNAAPIAALAAATATTSVATTFGPDASRRVGSRPIARISTSPTRSSATRATRRLRSTGRRREPATCGMRSG